MHNLLKFPLKQKKKIHNATDLGVRFLRNSMNKEQNLGDIGITSLALKSFFQCRRKYGPADGPWIRKGIEYVVSHQKEDGGIYTNMLGTYYTSIALLMLTSHPDVAKQYKDVIEKAKDYLLNVQCDEKQGYQADIDHFYGGIGYGGDERPDLSNTQFALEALRKAGVPASNPAFQKAIIFLQRCQNRSESNDQAWAGNDGGFVYMPASSAAGTTVSEKGQIQYRSYGSMTYAGIKSYIYADLKQDDPRVAAAIEWTRKNYDLTQNPGGAGLQGLYYYYHTFAKTMNLLEIGIFKDSNGVEHHWKEELAQILLAKQAPDGSWRNTHPRWWEQNPQLVTSYVIICLSHCLQ